MVQRSALDVRFHRPNIEVVPVRIASRLTRSKITRCGCLVAIVWIAGCNREPAGKSAGGPVEGALPAVRVAEAMKQELIDYREFTGRTSAIATVQIRARVSGYLLQTPRSKTRQSDDNQATPNDADSTDKQASDDSPWVSVTEGQLVEKGDLLFIVDPKPYELAVEQTQGLLEASVARFKQANQELQRQTELVERDASSRSDFDKAVAGVDELQGKIANLKATARRNLLDLGYTKVTSPIGGLLGRTLITEGNLITADTTILTTVVSVDPIYVDFNVDEQSVLDYRKRQSQGKVQSARDTKIPIRLSLANEDGFPHEGSIDFVDNTTDPNTGNTNIRGVFENIDGKLTPGLFARIQAPFTEQYDAVLIPTTAIAMDQQGRYVLIVDDEYTVARRTVTLGQIVDDKTVVTQGVRAGELVIVAGLQKVRPGAKVQTETADADAQAAEKNAALKDDAADAPAAMETGEQS